MKIAIASHNRRLAIASILVVAGLCGSFASSAPRPEAAESAGPANILLVIADDFGLDLSPCHDDGASKPHMPTLSRLCAEGLVFDRFWSAPECSPTRASILTGRYGFRTGVGGAVGRQDAGLATSELSLQTFIAQSGVGMATNVVGKWHLASNANGWEQHPSRMGVPDYVGLLSGTAQSYSRWSRTEQGATTTSTTYITTDLTDRAIAWTAQQKSPWFLWLAYTSPHEPLHLPPAGLHSQTDLTGTEADINARPRAYTFALAEAMDHELGRLLDSFDESTRARTVVIFIGDNGTTATSYEPRTDRLRAKGTLYQGGVNTPLVVSGAGVARVGERESALVGSVDLFATIAQLAGSAVTAYQDSLSIVPLLATSGAGARHDAYTELFGSDRQGVDGWTIRDERYKLIVLETGERRLFDLDADPRERTDLSGSTDADAQRALSRLQARGDALRASQ